MTTDNCYTLVYKVAKGLQNATNSIACFNHNMTDARWLDSDLRKKILAKQAPDDLREAAKHAAQWEHLQTALQRYIVVVEQVASYRWYDPEAIKRLLETGDKLEDAIFKQANIEQEQGR